MDCGDRSDELFCDTPCDEGQFQCKHPKSCVLREWRCDGEWDCVDGSDEGDCYGPGTGRELRCAPGEVPCNRGGGHSNQTGCVNAQWLCDGEQDCPDGGDEDDCESRSCEPNRFRCDTDKCVLWSSVCDGEKDCTDGSDEIPSACATVDNCRSGAGLFRCDNAKCVDRHFLCDGVNQCFDNSDERDCEDNPPCEFGVCSQLCEVKHATHKRAGSKKSGGTTLKSGSQTKMATSNVTLVPECFCAGGYELAQKSVCKALGDNATLIVANENTIRHLDPYGLNYVIDVDEERSEGASKIQSLDTYYDTDGVPVIVWSVREEERIYFHRQQTSGRKRDSRETPKSGKRDSREAPKQVGMPMTSLVLVEGVKDPRGLAVDWIGRNLYYIEGGTSSVNVVNLGSVQQSRLSSQFALQCCNLSHSEKLTTSSQFGFQSSILRC